MHNQTVSIRRMVLLGPPGAGKSTQGQRLATQTGLDYLSSGALFRAALAAGDDLGRQVRQFLDSGALVPDSLTQAVVAAHLEDLGEPLAFILDGFPRDLGQATWLNNFLTARRASLEMALLVDIDDETAFRRLNGRRVCSRCGRVYNIYFAPPRQPGICDEDGAPLIHRPDDAPDTVRRRLSVYHQNLDAVIDYYQCLGILRPVDGAESTELVQTRLMAAIEGA